MDSIVISMMNGFLLPNGASSWMEILFKICESLGGSVAHITRWINEDPQTSAMRRADVQFALKLARQDCRECAALFNKIAVDTRRIQRDVNKLAISNGPDAVGRMQSKEDVIEWLDNSKELSHAIIICHQSIIGRIKEFKESIRGSRNLIERDLQNIYKQIAKTEKKARVWRVVVGLFTLGVGVPLVDTFFKVEENAIASQVLDHIVKGYERFEELLEDETQWWRERLDLFNSALPMLPGGNIPLESKLEWRSAAEKAQNALSSVAGAYSNFNDRLEDIKTFQISYNLSEEQ